MNILPKKRWHVRTKENIARVRKDEAEAAAKEQEEQKRIENADREARINLLKLKGKQRRQEEESSSEVPEPVKKPKLTTIESSIIDPDGHVNLFSNHEYATDKTNLEHEKEVKEKKEEYEKKIGYLTYLGQDTNEALGKKNWYEVAPESSRFSRTNEVKVTYDKLVLKDADGKEKVKKLDEKDGEVDFKAKLRQDPLHIFSKYCKKEKITKSVPKEKSKKVESNNKMDKLQKLREARLKREREERRKTDRFLSGLNGTTVKPEESPPTPKIKPKYNSQFNPDLARQNYY